MRARNMKNKDDIINNCNYLINNPKEYKGKYNELFNNNNPIHIEVGMGKGKFISNMALNNPNINYIGIEKFDTIIASAIKKINPLPNLKLIKMDADIINEVFKKEIDLIYLNFVDPWPKKRHAKRRLTHETFLKKYDSIFKSVKHIRLKTDNVSLFENSLMYFSQYGYVIQKLSLDLFNSGIDNIMTEYEEKFTNVGMKIMYVNVYKE